MYKYVIAIVIFMLIFIIIVLQYSHSHSHSQANGGSQAHPVASAGEELRASLLAPLEELPLGFSPGRPSGIDKKQRT